LVYHQRHGRAITRKFSGWLATLLVFASFGITAYIFLQFTHLAPDHRQATVYLAPWLNVNTAAFDSAHLHNVIVNFELLLDPLSLLMMLIITGSRRADPSVLDRLHGRG